MKDISYLTFGISIFSLYNWYIASYYATLHGDDNGYPNKVSNSKYSVMTFIPYNLFGVQLMRLTNWYFIVTCLLQIWPDVSISGGQATMFTTLVNTILFSMGKDAYESIKTYF